MPSIQPKKRFGQHFLHERGVVERILAALAPQPGETVVEIGPGPGALTRPLLERVARLHAVELDRDLAARLQAEFPPERLSLHQADALKFDFCALTSPSGKLRLVGNLPYNISTPLLFHLLDQERCIQDMLFMLQKEVVDRMSAAPGGKDYGRLSVMIQWRLRVEKLFEVRPGAFTPPPKVDSAVVRLTPHAAPPVTVRDAVNFARLVKAAFAQRRKTLRNNLKDLLAAETIAALGIEPARRAETLTLAEFASLANALPPAA
jgi:16S rRNA (adenine1518-N6/adenine1519-N6)-dimethyltransferase